MLETVWNVQIGILGLERLKLLPQRFQIGVLGALNRLSENKIIVPRMFRFNKPLRSR